MSSFGIWLAGWLVLIVFLYAIAKTTAGAAAVYYILWLSVVLLLVTHSDEITGIFQAANIFQGQY